VKPVVLALGEGEVISIAGATIEVKAGAAGTTSRYRFEKL
jgi:hypothetical protein